MEVQGYADTHFARRMHAYDYRIQDRYQQPVTALVIYTNRDRRFHFTECRSSFFGTEIIYRFRTFILMDYTPEELRRSAGLYGWILEVARQKMKWRDTVDDHRFQINATR